MERSVEVLAIILFGVFGLSMTEGHRRALSYAAWRAGEVEVVLDQR
jgi:hypothetical protein